MTVPEKYDRAFETFKVTPEEAAKMENKFKKKLKDKIEKMKEKLENAKKLKRTLSEELLEENNILNIINVIEGNKNE